MLALGACSSSGETPTTEPPDGQPPTSVGTSPGSPDTGPDGNELPDTGTSAWLLSLIALAAIAAGSAMRRVGRRA